MKQAKILRSVIGLALILMLSLSVFVIPAGAATSKTYLDTMGYFSFNSDIEKNSCAPYKGKDRHENICTNAYQFYIDACALDYPNSDEVQKRGSVSFNVSFKLDKKYENFCFNLTSGEHIEAGSVKIAIYGDNNHLYGSGVTEETNQVPVSFSVKGVDVLTFEITAPTGGYSSEDNYIILNNAYFTGEGEEPTRPTDPPTEKPTTAPTEKPTTAPTDKPTTAPTEKPTTAPSVKPTDPSTEKPTVPATVDPTKPTNPSNPTNPTSVTAPTKTVISNNNSNTSSTNNTSGKVAGTVKTGNFILIYVIAVAAVILALSGLIVYKKFKKGSSQE
ncbi:MAG: NPCBM/NEW2 domain-containing protein [Acutalibacteraceae bacterium]